MTARVILAGLLASTALLAGCQPAISGTPVTSPESPTEPSFPTSRPTAAPPKTLTPAPTSTAVAPGAEVLPPENGYVFIETKSGKTRCQLNEDEGGCEAEFANSPMIHGMPANGVRVSPDGEVSWVGGNLGDIPTPPPDDRAYSAG